MEAVTVGAALRSHQVEIGGAVAGTGQVHAVIAGPARPELPRARVATVGGAQQHRTGAATWDGEVAVAVAEVAGERLHRIATACAVGLVRLLHDRGCGLYRDIARRRQCWGIGEVIEQADFGVAAEAVCGRGGEGAIRGHRHRGAVHGRRQAVAVHHDLDDVAAARRQPGINREHVGMVAPVA